MRKILCVGALAFLVNWGATYASPDVLPTQPISTILNKLKTQGYVSFEKIILQGDEYIVNGVDDKGALTVIRINSHSGEIIEMKKIDARISMLDVVDKVEAQGYSAISKIESTDDIFIVQALDPNGKTVTLKIDAISGKIIKN